MGQQVTLTRTRRAGFSLLEVMLALAVLAVLGVSLILVLTGGLKLLGYSERSDVAASLAKEMAERVAERPAEPVAGVFDGRVPTAQVFGFPPAHYPMKSVERDYHYVVEVVSQDERLWHLQVEIYEGQRRAARLESLVLK